MVSGWISVMTLLIIPSYTRADAISVTTITDRNRNVLGVIRKQEPVSVMFQIFLVLVMPFRDSPDKFREKLYTDFFRATIDEAHAKGIL